MQFTPFTRLPPTANKIKEQSSSTPAVLNKLKSDISSLVPAMTPSHSLFLAGSISGAVISSCVQPLDVLRTRIQGDAAQGVSRTTLETLRLVLKQDGLRHVFSHSEGCTTIETFLPSITRDPLTPSGTSRSLTVSVNQRCSLAYSGW